MPFFLPPTLDLSSSWSDLGLPLEGEQTLRCATILSCFMPYCMGFLRAELDLAGEPREALHKLSREKFGEKEHRTTCSPVRSRGATWVLSGLNPARGKPPDRTPRGGRQSTRPSPRARICRIHAASAYRADGEQADAERPAEGAFSSILNPLEA